LQLNAQNWGLSIGLAVNSLELAIAELSNKGVTFAPQVIEDGFLRIAFFSDPDKNPLYLCEFQEKYG